MIDVTQAAIQGTLGLQDPATCSGSGSTLTCSYDFSAAQSNYDSVCEAAGGQVYLTGFDINCDVSANGQNGQVTYQFASLPECLGMSCDTTKIQDMEYNTTSALTTAMNDLPALSNCGAELASSAPFMGASALLLAGSALWASVMLFF
jgi:hypothetical protein